MTDAAQEEAQMAQPAPIQRIVAKIGDGESMLFSVEHPNAPFVVAQLFKALGGDAVSCPPRREVGRIIYAFSRPPQPEEFIAVVVG